MKKLILFMVGSVCVLSSCKGQRPAEKAAAIPLSKIVPLRIGDTVPDIVFKHMLNYKDPIARISDFKGKLLILDFWNTWCGSCLEAMPKLDSLQQLFKGNIQILPVTNEPIERVKRTLTHNKRLAKLHLPSVLEDSVLSMLFPHTMVPHEVWITGAGKVLAITATSQVTARHIGKILAGEKVNLIPKDDRLNYDVNKPLLLNSNGGGISNLLYHSEITGYLDGLPAKQAMTDYQGGKRVFATNVTILSLYQLAFKNLWRMPENRIILQVTDPSKYTIIRKKEVEDKKWRRQHLYCYELIVPTRDINRCREYVKQDLDRFFNLNGRMDTIPVKCWLLVQLGGENIVKSKGGKATNNLFSDEKNKFMRNEKMSVLAAYLNQKVCKKRPVVNATEFEGTVDMNFQLAGSNLTNMKKALNAKGFDLISGIRKMKMFILSSQAIEPSQTIHKN